MIWMTEYALFIKAGAQKVNIENKSQENTTSLKSSRHTFVIRRGESSQYNASYFLGPNGDHRRHLHVHDFF